MAVYELKESLHTIYEAEHRKEGNERIEAWIRSVPQGLTEVFGEQITAMGNWRDEILNFFDTRVTNSATERVNRFIRLTRQLGNGYRFEVLRGKMLYSSPRTGKFWEGDGVAETIPGSMGFSLGDSMRGGVAAGADLEWLISQMEDRNGEWADPALWRSPGRAEGSRVM